MGEYAIRKSDKQEIKIGTCESMYYMRYEDRNKVIPIYGNVDPMKHYNLFYRLPIPEEDHLSVGEYSYPMPTVDLIGFNDPSTVESKGLIQVTHENGLLINVNCYHGQKLPESNEDVKFHWNGKNTGFVLWAIKGLKNNKTRPVIKCKHCSEMWSYDWEDIKDFIPENFKQRVNHHFS